MKLSDSKTVQNLGKAYLLEIIARSRYEYYAKQATQEGFQQIGQIFEQIADNELAHAKVFYQHIVQGAPEVGEGLALREKLPFKLGQTQSNIQIGMLSEQREYTSLPKFAKVARDEGFTKIAKSFELIANVERQHHQVFATLHQQMADGQLYAKDAKVEWKCSNCGHTASDKTAWLKCPICGYPQGFVYPVLQTPQN